MTEPIYVEVEDPKGIRRALLEASKETVQLLQRYESIRGMKQERESEVRKLLKEFEEISHLADEIKREMPKVDVRKLPAARARKEIRYKPMETVQKKPRKESTEVTSLEQELREIEEKLKEL